MINTLVIALDEEVIQLNLSIGIFAIIQATWFWTNIVIICAELRIALGMFLQLNPYYEPFATLWTFTDPVFNFGRAYYPKVLGFDLCPWVNMLLINEFVVALDIWLHGINEMNSISDQRTVVENQELGVENVDERYIFVDKYLRAGEPKTEKEWLESFSFEDIYFHRVPGAPPFGQGPQIKIPTSLPIDDRLPISAYPDIEDLGNIEYGISLGDNPLNFIFHLVLDIVHIPLHLLQFLASH